MMLAYLLAVEGMRGGFHVTLPRALKRRARNISCDKIFRRNIELRPCQQAPLIDKCKLGAKVLLTKVNPSGNGLG